MVCQQINKSELDELIQNMKRLPEAKIILIRGFILGLQAGHEKKRV